jgi:hypothetical protein
MKSIFIQSVSWRDKVNGNTYTATAVEVDGVLIGVDGFGYGDGSNAVHFAGEVLVSEGLATRDEVAHTFHGLRRNGVALYVSRPNFVTKVEVKQFVANMLDRHDPAAVRALVDASRRYVVTIDEETLETVQGVADALATVGQQFDGDEYLIGLANDLEAVTGVEYCDNPECDNLKPCFRFN